MITIKGDIFEYPCDGFCVTTNGFVKPNGKAVMGRGVAASARDRITGIDRELGRLVIENGARVEVVTTWRGRDIVAFPVKTDWQYCAADKSNVVPHQKAWFKPGDMVPGYATVANLCIVERSAIQLMSLVNQMGWKTVALTKPGCHNGQLNWDDVKPILEKYFDDRFHVVDFTA